MSINADHEVALYQEVTHPLTSQERIPYAMMELTSVARDQRALERLLVDLAQTSKRPVQRRMAVECLGQLVRERRRLLTDRPALLLCELVRDEDRIVRDNAALSLYEFSYWLSPKRRMADIPIASLISTLDAACLRLGSDPGDLLWLGWSDDPAVARIASLVETGIEMTSGVAGAIVANLNSAGNPDRSRIRYLHLKGLHYPWWAWVFESAKVEGLSYRSPGVGRVVYPRVSRKHVKNRLGESTGKFAQFAVIPWHGRGLASPQCLEREVRTIGATSASASIRE